MMQTNWHWDLQIPMERIREILNNDQDPSFVSVASRLLARNNNPKEVFSLITPLSFCRRFYAIQREIKKDEWDKERAALWRATYQRYLEEFKRAGVRLREKTSNELDEITRSMLEKMRIFRNREGLSQKDLAARIGYSQQFVSGIESGREKLTLAYLQKFAKATHSRFDWDLYSASETNEVQQEYGDLFQWAKEERDRALQAWGSSGPGKALMEIFTYCPDRVVNAKQDQWHLAGNISSAATVHYRQDQLRQAMESSQIHSFGWPIGVVMDREEYRPKPVQNGIQAIIPTRDESYDYWMLRNDLVFYLLKTLFEDQRAQGKIFLDTRIVRTAETILRISKLYEELGVSNKTNVVIRIRYSGLGGRELTTADPGKHLTKGRTCIEDQAETTIRESLGSLKSNLVELTHRTVSELTMLFDYFQPSKEKVVQPLLQDFFKGESSVQQEAWFRPG